MYCTWTTGTETTTSDDALIAREGEGRKAVRHFQQANTNIVSVLPTPYCLQSSPSFRRTPYFGHVHTPTIAVLSVHSLSIPSPRSMVDDRMPLASLDHVRPSSSTSFVAGLNPQEPFVDGILDGDPPTQDETNRNLPSGDPG
jgi:hypothetical protein